MPTAKNTSEKKGGAAQLVASMFDWALGGLGGWLAVGIYTSRGRRAMIDKQKFRNNYAAMSLRDLFCVCRRVAKSHWFVRPVLALRHASHTDGFQAVDGEGEAIDPQAYDFSGLVSDIAWEDLRSSNVIAIWKKGGTTTPDIAILKAEQVDYRHVGGLEIIRIQYSNELGRCGLSLDTRNTITERLGQRMADAQLLGKSIEIVKGLDEEWDFEVMTGGPRGDGLEQPEIESILDTIDFLDLMGIGDWNIGWFRKDFARLLRKGYKGTSGAGPTAGVDITKPEVKEIGDGLSKMSGNANLVMNHDMDLGYLGVDPKNIDPESIKSAIDRLMMFGGIEGAVLIGGFSQQNGAAPTLMRNARASAFARRKRIARFIAAIFGNAEFKSVLDQANGGIHCEWSDRTLYSVDELLAMATRTADGVASTRTRRERLGLDNDREGKRLKAEHADRTAYAPSFEAKQGLLPAMFPDELGGATAPPVDPTTGGDGGEGGRPASSSEI
jgi:hypothetical protein